MKDFSSWGVKIRAYPEKNYKAIWSNLVTIRIGKGIAGPLEPELSEFYDVGINTKCNAECPFCYVSATHNGINYPDICGTWKKWMDTYSEELKDGILITNKPFQIAIGSTGEPTIHPDFCEFLKTVYESNVVPNYTTNGITLSKLYKSEARKILNYTSKYVGGVAVSLSNPELERQASKAIHNLIEYGDTKVNIHHIISDMESLDRFVNNWYSYGTDIHYHILLPLMPSGRSKSGIEKGVFERLENIIEQNSMGNVAFGAHFADSLKTSKIKTWIYPPESFSKNVILTKDHVKITPSSFNLNPIKEILL